MRPRSYKKIIGFCIAAVALFTVTAYALVVDVGIQNLKYAVYPGGCLGAWGMIDHADGRSSYILLRNDCGVDVTIMALAVRPTNESFLNKRKETTPFKLLSMNIKQKSIFDYKGQDCTEENIASSDSCKSLVLRDQSNLNIPIEKDESFDVRAKLLKHLLLTISGDYTGHGIDPL